MQPASLIPSIFNVEKGICSYLMKFYCRIDTVYTEYAGFLKNYFMFLCYLRGDTFENKMTHVGLAVLTTMHYRTMAISSFGNCNINQSHTAALPYKSISIATKSDRSAACEQRLFHLCIRGTRTQPLLCVGGSVHYWGFCAINKRGFWEITFSSLTHICLALRRLLTFCLTLTR